MGLGPSIKMTTLHHFRCPVCEVLSEDPEILFPGIIVTGVSELCDDKLANAVKTAELADTLQTDGAIVAIDGWGNHHVDFVNVIEELGIRGIPSVGLSYMGIQGRLVCDSPYVDCIVDFNKCSSGFESCVVGQNNLNRYDAVKAAALLKNKVRKSGKRTAGNKDMSVAISSQLRNSFSREYLSVTKAEFSEQTKLSSGKLTIRRGMEKEILKQKARIKDIRVQILSPEQKGFFVNSNLDFSPVACKVSGTIGTGVTRVLSGLTVMLTGVEVNGFQPSNIGSSEGILSEQVVWNQAGTPSDKEMLLHIDVILKEGEGRTAQGIQEAHEAADEFVEEIRKEMMKCTDEPVRRERYGQRDTAGKYRIVLVKLVSGLGNMYDTVLFPKQPCGIIGVQSMRESGNVPQLISPDECRDGVIHSLI